MNIASQFALLGLSAFVFQAAQSADDPGPMDETFVSGSLSPLARSELGSAYTVIPGEEFERREARLVTDVLRSVPGFAVSRTGVVGSQTQVRVRGSEANHVIVLVDGVRVTDPATSDEFRWEYLSTAGIDRVEIVRGAQSALWGSEAMAAVVNVITKQQKQGSSASGYLESGSFSTNNGGLYAGTAGDGWSLNSSFDYLGTDGNNIARVGDEDDGLRLRTFNVGGRFDAQGDVTLDFGIRATDAQSDVEDIDFFVTGLPEDTTNRENVSDSLSGRAGLAWGSPESRLSQQARLQFYNSKNSDVIDGSVDSFTAAERVTLAYQADIEIGSDLMAIALERENTEYRQRGEAAFGFDPNQDQEIEVTSLVAEYQGRAIDRLTWILGVRFDDNSDFGDVLNGRLSAAYQLADATKLRGSVGTGQKNPSFTERFGFFPNQFVGNPGLKPESSVSAELGIDQGLLDGDLQLQATLFIEELKDEIDGFDTSGPVATAVNLDGESDRSGIEVALQWAATASINVGAYYSYVDSTEPLETGEEVRELRRPQHAGGLSVDVSTPGDRLTASLNADYSGERRDTFFPPFPDPSEIVRLGDYWLVDLSVQFQLTDQIELFARGTNLLDEDYEEVLGFATPGRGGFAGVRVNFGQ